ncbi:hypothetical protein FRB98_004375 [Tulasnella sp. 332]|nr:hypothetical protein FRB98_004375 [Tulasnella sp. 332]
MVANSRRRNPLGQAQLAPRHPTPLPLPDLLVLSVIVVTNYHSTMKDMWSLLKQPDSNRIWAMVATASVGTIIAVNLLAKMVRRAIFMPTLTIMSDLPNIGTARKDGRRKGRAVICGGSIAGLIAASMCADHFDSVLIIEAEDSLPIDPPEKKEMRTMANGLPTRVSPRKRVMQYFGLHYYQPPVLLGLQRMFPALHEQAAHFGFVLAPMSFANFECGGVKCPEVYRPADSHAPMVVPATRETFETLIRRLVMKYKPNVSFLTGTVTGFEREAVSGRKLSGVTVNTSGGEKFEPAAFVVDATGAAQTSYRKWLTNAGFGPLPVSLREDYHPHINYVQSTWTIPKDLLPEIGALLPYGLHPGVVHYMLPDLAKGEQTGQSFILLERSQLVLMTGAWGTSTDNLPHTIQEVRAHTKATHDDAHPAPQWLYKLFDALEAHEEECAPWYADFDIGALSFIKYHQAESGSLPSNWAAVGDSVMKVNPIYGQGCTKAMMDTLALDSLFRNIPALQEFPSDFAREYFQKAIKRTGGMWDGNKAVDYGFSGTEPSKGETLADGAFAHIDGQYDSL